MSTIVRSRFRANSHEELTELFDRKADPYQLRNVAADHPDVVGRMDGWVEAARQVQDARRAALGAGQMVELTDEEKANLCALGYVDCVEPHGDEPPKRKAPRTE